jgi:hypothetical protein
MNSKLLIDTSNKKYNLTFKVDFSLNNFKTRKELNQKIKLIELENITGVYIIKKENKIVYIGSSGKYIKEGETLKKPKSGNGIGGRLIRSSTPYSFLIDENKLGYRKDSKDNRKVSKNYTKFISLNKLSIDIIKSGNLSSSFIEHVMLQTYLDENDTIPLINQQL